MDKLHIEHSDVCLYCRRDPWIDKFGSPDRGRVYSRARAEWMEAAVKQLMDMDEGDDTWVEWKTQHNELIKQGE